MITGARAARRPGVLVSDEPVPENPVCTMSGWRRTRKNTTMHRPAAISSAGMTEAANSAPVETAARPA